MNAQNDFDVFVIGGGINGCGIARDAAGRGYSVCLAEMNDLAGGTSSGSTKLVHGGLRYLEFYEFRLVREALKEREVLWAMAPHIIWPLRFVLPHHKGLRPAWLLRLGLFLYDHLGGRKLLPPTRVVDMQHDAIGAPLKPMFAKGFEYSDCWVDDARLVVLNARDAAERGAAIHTRSKVVSANRADGVWRIVVESASGERQEYTASLLVNASGPWVDRILSSAVGKNDARNVRLVQGSHIVVPKMYDHDRCYIFQNADGRIMFAIPYEDDFTLIGTTDKDYTDDPADAAISEQETVYLCEAASAYFKSEIRRDDVVWTFSAVRPLFDDGASAAQEATRDYVLKADTGGDENGPALINIFGGKITTYRRLAESALALMERHLGKRGAAWTAGATLPGGDFVPTGFEDQLSGLRARYAFLDEKHARRLLRLYGTRAAEILGEATSASDLGQHFGADLYEAELSYLAEKEWACSAEDVLWRRTKLGLRLSQSEVDAVDRFLRERNQNRHAQSGEDQRAASGG